MTREPNRANTASRTVGAERLSAAPGKGSSEALADLQEGEVHVWTATIDVYPSHRRASGRAGAHARAHAREILRELLGGYAGADPAALRFRAGRHGKPQLERHSWLGFNMSHCEGIALYAVGRGIELGVDIETLTRPVDVARVARRAFGPELAVRLAQLDCRERKRELLRLWVCHEARLKCLGLGLGGEKTPQACAGSAVERHCWTAELEIGEERAIAAIAASQSPRRIERRRWEPSDLRPSQR